MKIDKRSNEHKKIFVDLTIEDFNIVTDIFKNKGFRQLVHNKSILNGDECADPFIIAKAETVKGILVTEEKFAEKSTNKLPNVCKERGIECINLKKFMELESFNF